MKPIFSLILFLFFIKGNSQSTGKFEDKRDGQTYKTIAIGNQIWMAENLNFDTTRSWCENCEENGRIYQFEGAFMACPQGWHIPTEAEWKQLFNFLGGEDVAIEKLIQPKGTDTIEYTGFNLIPLPERGDDKIIKYHGQEAVYCSSTVPMDRAYNTIVFDCAKKTVTVLGRQFTYGVHVRCIKNFNDTYYPIEKEKAEKYLERMDQIFLKLDWKSLEYFATTYDSYTKSSDEFDFIKLKSTYKKSKENDSLIYQEFLSEENVDTTSMIKEKYIDSYKAYSRLFDALQEFFKQLEKIQSQKNNSVGILVKTPQMEDLFYDLSYQQKLLQIKIAYFKEKYKLE